jgi:uncharacterized protein (DUF1330 family)
MPATGKRGFIVVEIAGEHANQLGILRDLASLIRSHDGEVLAWAPAGKTAGLEPGTVSAGLLVARWAQHAAARRISLEILLPAIRAQLPSQASLQLFLVDALPDDGLPDMPDIPTVASVPKPAPGLRNMFLIVRGTAWDATRLNAYRDVILPMHKERGGYYEVFAVQPGQVEALAGEWTEQIFAISRWPTRAAAEDFWYSERYQREAIPLRLGAGRFTVHALESVLVEKTASAVATD